MVDHLLEDLERQCRDVGAVQGGLRDVARVADGGGQDLRVVLEEPDDLGQLADDLHAVLVDVVDPADERRQQRRASLGGEQPLIGREDQGAVGLDAFGPEPAHRGQAVLGHRHLHDDVVGQLRVVPALAEHALDIVRDHLRGHRAAVD